MRGQSLAEVALAMPLFLLLTLGVADGGRAFYYQEAVVNATRQALDEAVTDVSGTTQPYAGAQACAAVGSTAQSVSKTAHVPWQTGDTSYLANIANAAAMESTTTGLPAGSKIAGSTITVTWHCKNGTAIGNSANGGITDPNNVASDSVEVQISYSFTLLTPMISRAFSGTPTIAADIQGRAQY